MLKRIKLKNFKRHRDLEISFAAGLNVVRAANEAGKSTVLHAIAYALFGTKALAQPLSETVTWGEPENSLKVTLELDIEGVAYTVTRGKGGAEITYDDGIVTGQTETVKFVEKLLRADSAAAPRLMLANQNEIRGALDSGTKATTELIERLADFDQIDRLLELAADQWSLGPTAATEAAIAAETTALDNARAEAVEPDLAGIDANIRDLEGALDGANAGVAEAEEALRGAQAGLQALQESNHRIQLANQEARNVRDRALQAVTSAERARDKAQDALKAGIRDAEPPPAYDFEKARARLEQLQAAGQLRASHKMVAHVLGTPAADATYDEPMERLLEDIAAAKRVIETSDNEARELERRILRNTGLITTGSCTACGKDISDVPEVKAKNAALQASIDADNAERAKLIATRDDTREELAALEQIRKASEEPLRVLANNPDLVRRVGGDLPPTLEWIGGDVPDDASAEAKALQASIDEANRALARLEAAAGRLPALRQAVDEAQAVMSAAQGQLAALGDAEPLPLANTDAAVEEVAAATRAQRVAVESKGDLQLRLDGLKRDRAHAVERFQAAQRAVVAAEQALKDRKAYLEELTFNNGTVKRIKTVRPLIADKLWSLVLSAVSSYFSEMRGEQSLVSKDKDGFTVNGHGISTLSGSTLDILGLAIRVALVRTFLPMTPFLCLDEPGHGCDDDRTQLMLGFLAGCGFQQTVLVTHESISEAVADNVITIPA